MSERTTHRKPAEGGEIRISPAAIARVARDAALQSYGVVGLVEPNVWVALRDLLLRSDTPGVRVRVRRGRIVVDLFVVVQYGTRISEVAQGVMNRVKYALEQMVGIPIAEINVHVRDVRVNHESEIEGGRQE